MQDFLLYLNFAKMYLLVSISMLLFKKSPIICYVSLSTKSETTVYEVLTNLYIIDVCQYQFDHDSIVITTSTLLSDH